MGFLALPEELVILILSFLPLADLTACQRTNRSLYHLVKSSTLLQYCIACQAAGVTDNPYSQIPVSKRLLLLEDRESAWSHCRYRSITFLPDTSPTGVFDVADGLYIAGLDPLRLDGRRPRTTGLKYLVLPYSEESSAPKEIPWKFIAGEEHFGDSSLIHARIAIEEHDLMGLVTYTSQSPWNARGRIDVVLLEVSSGEYHPLALQPKFLVTEVTQDYSSYDVEIEIAGDHLGILIRIGGEADRRSMFLFNWKTGELKAVLESAPFTYTTFIFLTEDIVLLPNMRIPSLDLFRLPATGWTPSNPHRLTVALRLYLPLLVSGIAITQAFCSVTPTLAGRGKQSPGRANPWSDRYPFMSSPLDGIIVCHIAMESLALERFPCALVVHVHALLSQLDKRDGKASIPCASSDPLSQGERGSVSNATDGPTSDRVVSWADWGPPMTRWLETRYVANLWITSVWGHRYVQVHTARGAKPITICDFNPYHVRKCLAGLVPLQSQEATLFIHAERDQVPWEVFGEPVWSELPFVECISKEYFNYHDLMMDEGRIVGLYTDDDNHVCAVDTLFFG